MIVGPGLPTYRVFWLYVAMLMGIATAYPIGMTLALYNLGPGDGYNTLLTLADSTITLFLTAMLVLMTILGVMLTERATRANELLAAIAHAQEIRSEAQFEIRHIQEPESAASFPGVTHPGTFLFEIVNSGWKDSAIDRIWFEGVTVDGGVHELEVRCTERGVPSRGTDLMVRAGDRRALYGEGKNGYLPKVPYRQFTLYAKPVLGKSGYRVMRGP